MANLYFTFVGTSGLSLVGTIQRLSDGFYRSDANDSFLSNPAFSSKDISLTEGTAENRGTYSLTINASGFNDDLYLFRVHNAGAGNLILGTQHFAVKDNHEVAIGEQSPVFDVYHADIFMDRDSVRDEYTIRFFRNAAQVTSGITSPTLEVLNRNGNFLIAATGLTEIGITGAYKLDVSGNYRQTVGESYEVTTRATINDRSRFYSWIIGRDEI